jgi:hypothetical protein
LTLGVILPPIAWSGPVYLKNFASKEKA